MSISITNNMPTPLGVWTNPTAFRVAPAMATAWTENVTPSMEDMAVITLLQQADAIKVQQYVDPGPLEGE